MSPGPPLHHLVDVDRHAGQETPAEPVPKPTLGSSLKLDAGVIEGTNPIGHASPEDAAVPTRYPGVSRAE